MVSHFNIMYMLLVTVSEACFGIAVSEYSISGSKCCKEQKFSNYFIAVQFKDVKIFINKPLTFRLINLALLGHLEIASASLYDLDDSDSLFSVENFHRPFYAFYVCMRLSLSFN